MNHSGSYDFFPPEAVTAWVETKLSSYYREDDAVTLNLGDGPTAPEVLTKFAELAKAMKLPITSRYGSLTIKRPKPMAEQRTSAIAEMRSAYERGDIDADGHTVENTGE